MKSLKYKCYVTGYVKWEYVNLELLRLRQVIHYFFHCISQKLPALL